MQTERGKNVCVCVYGRMDGWMDGMIYHNAKSGQHKL